MNKILLISGFILLADIEGNAQNVTATSGGSGTVGTMTVNYTIGEAFVATYQNGGSILTQGFHQPYYTVVAVEENFPLGTLKIFPNPTTSILQVQFELPNFDDINVSLLDMTGKIIVTSKVNSDIWQTDLSGLANGYYLLSVSDFNNSKSSSFKIFKSN